MSLKRILICIDTRDGACVDAHGRPLPDLPSALAERMEGAGADEIVFCDASTSADGRGQLLELVRRTSSRLGVPLVVGGGIVDVTDVEQALQAGAQRVSINTAAVQRPAVITEAAMRFGNERIVASVDTRVEKRSVENAMRSSAAATGLLSTALPESEWYRVYTHHGSTPTMLDAISWAQQCAQLGAGEILLTSIDREGQRAGYDLELTARAVEGVQVPVIASGGHSALEHVRDVFLLAGAAGVMATPELETAGIGIARLKETLAQAGVSVRLSASA